eukprot:gene26163-32058_t
MSKAMRNLELKDGDTSSKKKGKGAHKGKPQGGIKGDAKGDAKGSPRNKGGGKGSNKARAASEKGGPTAEEAWVQSTSWAGEAGVSHLRVRALRSDLDARYRDLERAARRAVHDQGGGRVGYVHVPDMGRMGFAEFHRHWEMNAPLASLLPNMGKSFNGYEKMESRKEALVVDLRNNAGGYVSEMLLGHLAQRSLGYEVFRRYGLENRGVEPDVVVEITPQDHAAGRDPQLETAVQRVSELLASSTMSAPCQKLVEAAVADGLSGGSARALALRD